MLGGIQPQPLPFQLDGTLDLDAVEAAIKPDDFHFARTRLLCLENTLAGAPLPLDYADQARVLCDRRGLRMHLDGARLFNAAIALGVPVTRLSAGFDSVSVCLSKGLGAPAGSVLCGDAEFIGRARRTRKMLGGGMRQAGILAAAGIHALQNHVDRLAHDHRRAGQLAQALNGLDSFAGRVRCATNMVFVEIEPRELSELAKHLEKSNVRARGPRWVIHLDVDDTAIDRIIESVRHFQSAGA